MNQVVASKQPFNARRAEQIAREYLAEYGTVDAAMSAVVHGAGLDFEAAERVCAELELIGENV